MIIKLRTFFKKIFKFNNKKGKPIKSPLNEIIDIMAAQELKNASEDFKSLLQDNNLSGAFLDGTIKGVLDKQKNNLQSKISLTISTNKEQNLLLNSDSTLAFYFQLNFKKAFNATNVREVNNLLLDHFPPPFIPPAPTKKHIDEIIKRLKVVKLLDIYSQPKDSILSPVSCDKNTSPFLPPRNPVSKSNGGQVV